MSDTVSKRSIASAMTEPDKNARLNHTRTRLAHSLGFPDYPSSTLAQPYLNYIENHYIGSSTLEDYLVFFHHVVLHFSQAEKRERNIRSFIDELSASTTEEQPLFSGTDEKGPRRELVADTVLYILGTWMMILSYFVKSNGCRQVEMAYCVRRGKNIHLCHGIALNATLPQLLEGAGLFITSKEDFGSVPVNSFHDACFQGIHSSPADSLESVSITSGRLNAHTLSSLADTRIHWTYNLSRHLLLTKISGQYVLEIFALPCLLRSSSVLVKAGVPRLQLHEIEVSYSILFNPYPSPFHSRFGSIISSMISSMCWCRFCACNRLRRNEIKNLKGKATAARKRRGERRKSEYDPLLEVLMASGDCEDWSYELFPHLWARILVLEEHMQTAKPWNFWVLFRDRRNTLQYWTFFFGTLILILTFLQVVLGAVQVVGSFRPAAPTTTAVGE